jgi:hypothetical protein
MMVESSSATLSSPDIPDEYPDLWLGIEFRPIEAIEMYHLLPLPD